MFDKSQFRSLVTFVLKCEDLYSEAAVNLVLGTIAQESKFGTYLRQLGSGPARGICQMEQPTFNWLKGVYGRKYPKLGAALFEEVEWDLYLAILVCRLRYRVVPEPLPAADDLLGLARYWKKYYNTYLGKGTESEFIANYRRYVQ